MTPGRLCRAQWHGDHLACAVAPIRVRQGTGCREWRDSEIAHAFVASRQQARRALATAMGRATWLPDFGETDDRRERGGAWVCGAGACLRDHGRGARREGFASDVLEPNARRRRPARVADDTAGGRPLRSLGSARRDPAAACGPPRGWLRPASVQRGRRDRDQGGAGCGWLRGHRAARGRAGHASGGGTDAGAPVARRHGGRGTRQWPPPARRSRSARSAGSREPGRWCQGRARSGGLGARAPRSVRRRGGRRHVRPGSSRVVCMEAARGGLGRGRVGPVAALRTAAGLEGRRGRDD